MKDSEILGIVRKAEQVAKNDKASISVRFNCTVHPTGVDVTTSDRLSMKGRRLLAKILHVSLKTKRTSYDPTQLMRSGERTDKTGNKFELWLFNTAQCKVVGTKKEIRTVKKVIKEEETMLVKEEVEVPVYECPKGTVLE